MAYLADMIFTYNCHTDVYIMVYMRQDIVFDLLAYVANRYSQWSQTTGTSVFINGAGTYTYRVTHSIQAPGTSVFINGAGTYTLFRVVKRRGYCTTPCEQYCQQCCNYSNQCCNNLLTK